MDGFMVQHVRVGHYREVTREHANKTTDLLLGLLNCSCYKFRPDFAE